MLLVLKITPKQVVQRAQRVNFQQPQRVAVASTDVLKPQGDRVHGLHKRRFLLPVRPDQLQQARVGEFPTEYADAVLRQVNAFILSAEDGSLERLIFQLSLDDRQVRNGRVRKAINIFEVAVPQCVEVNRSPIDPRAARQIVDLFGKEGSTV